MGRISPMKMREASGEIVVKANEYKPPLEYHPPEKSELRKIYPPNRGILGMPSQQQMDKAIRDKQWQSSYEAKEKTFATAAKIRAALAEAHLRKV